MPGFENPKTDRVVTPAVDDLKVAVAGLDSQAVIMGDCPETDACMRVARWLQGEMERVRQVGLLLDICSDIGVSIPSGVSPVPVPFCQTIRNRRCEVPA